LYSSVRAGARVLHHPCVDAQGVHSVGNDPVAARFVVRRVTFRERVRSPTAISDH